MPEALPTEVTEEPLLWDWYSKQMDVLLKDDDYTAFINAKPTKLGLNSSPIEWWSALLQQETYPALLRLAIDVLILFLQSAVSEGTFSSARRTILWERATLGGEIVEQTECSYDWQVSGLAYDERYAVVDSDDDDNDLLQSQASFTSL